VDKILVKILYIHPTKELDLNSFNGCGISHFGTKVINEAFALFGYLSPSSIFLLHLLYCLLTPVNKILRNQN